MCDPQLRCVTFQLFVRRVADYWEGYKLFCYAFYSHSSRHESEFEQSKLGSCLSFGVCFVSARLSTISLSQIKHAPQETMISGISTPCLFLFRSACVEAPRSPTSSLPPCAPHDMHTHSPSCGDVLHVGVAGGLQRFGSTYAAFRLGVRIGVNRSRTVSSPHGLR